jgi:hypothetical protein
MAKEATAAQRTVRLLDPITDPKGVESTTGPARWSTVPSGGKPSPQAPRGNVGEAAAGVEHLTAHHLHMTTLSAFMICGAKLLSSYLPRAMSWLAPTICPFAPMAPDWINPQWGALPQWVYP